MESLRVGLDLGGTKLAGVLIDANRKILASASVPTPSHGRWVAATMLELIDNLTSSVGVDKGRIEFLGVGLPGLIGDDEKIHSSTHVPGLAGVDLRAELSQSGNWRVHLENDVHCAAITAMENGGQSFVLVTVGTGLGGAIVLSGALQRGARGFAGEVGHMIVVAGGELCVCGKRGCVEAYASGRSLTQRVEREFARGRLSEFVDPAKPTRVPTPKAVMEGCGENEVAREIVEEFCFYLAVGISNLLEFGDFERVLIGGGVSESFDFFANELREQYQLVMSPSRMRSDVEISRVEFGPLAGAIGATRLIDII